MYIPVDEHHSRFGNLAVCIQFDIADVLRIEKLGRDVYFFCILSNFQSVAPVFATGDADVISCVLALDFDTLLVTVIDPPHGVRAKWTIRIEWRSLTTRTKFDLIKHGRQNCLAHQIIGDGFHREQFIIVLGNEIGVDVPFDELRMRRELHQEVDVRVKADNVVLG